MAREKGNNPFEEVTDEKGATDTKQTDSPETPDDSTTDAATDTDRINDSENSSGTHSKTTTDSSDTVTEPNTPTENTHSETQTQSPSSEDGINDPAFMFDHVVQKSIYVEEDTWIDFTDVKHFTDTELRQEYDIHNVETRELDEAFLKVAVEELSPEQIAQMVVMLRQG